MLESRRANHCGNCKHKVGARHAVLNRDGGSVCWMLGNVSDFGCARWEGRGGRTGFWVGQHLTEARQECCSGS